MNSPTPALSDALAQSDLLHGRADLEVVIRAMGQRIDAALDGERAVFLTVMNGALIFAGQLALAIRTDLEFDYVHATRYRGAISGKALQWLREPMVSLKGRVVLLVDDILDEGHTLKEVRDDCYHRGAKKVYIASLCTKKHDRLIDGITSDFNGVELPDRFVFGYGMDYYEQGRNLAGIYALKEKNTL
ncbi:MAG: hypoxanthine-guanine phosphoribosyltransferase [Rhodanobacter sp.]|nr:MAG: hypoxanthine-guanine phosphoribosyltransferase [Rhodanobacter sp.]TAM02988.1 MAG: hypoxanthine-guanine phosphoribosyltransferase [Rhodanobacter sp.]TAM39617.1 MAG: hypoxanthine-guanine phosphoribosyltransferase [Rhodanobacter sp.]TAN27599.1 MAG: hypoxanthine-guanine phosphoribosyltransferase [Rhodanobacter sp.]